MLKNLLSLIFLALLALLFAGVSLDWNFGRAPQNETTVRLCEHNKPREECENCNPKLSRGGTYIVQEREAQPGECPNILKRVVLASGVTEAMSMGFQEVRKLKISEKIRTVGETMYPPMQYARISPKLSGFLQEIRVAIGQEASAGTALAILDSPEICRAKADYLQARAVLDLKEYTESQEKLLEEKKISAAREVREAKTGRLEALIALKAATFRLHSLGIDSGRVSDNDLSGKFAVISPIGGKITEIMGVVGELSVPDRHLFAIAETDPIWVRIDVFEKDLLKLKPGQKAVFTLDDLTRRKFSGKIVNIGGEMDETSRTGKAYAEIRNPEHILRANMFGAVAISLDEPEPRLLVSGEAVHHDADCEFVFVRAAKNTFQTRRVEIGLILDNGVEILSGLSEGETVVVDGSFLLKTEILRSQIGAGCCPDD